jgi:hypothetical protein
MGLSCLGIMEESEWINSFKLPFHPLIQGRVQLPHHGVSVIVMVMDGQNNAVKSFLPPFVFLACNHI